MTVPDTRNARIAVAEYVRSGIDRLFREVAEQVGEDEVDLSGWSEEEITGIPLGIFAANSYMLSCWEAYLEYLAEKEKP